MNVATNWEKQGLSVKKKRKKVRRSTFYKARSRTKKRKKLHSETNSDFELEEEPKQSVKYNFKMEGLLSELDYFKPSFMQLSEIGD